MVRQFLTPVYGMTGLESFYGQTPGNYEKPDEYTLNQFFENLTNRNSVFEKNSDWQVLRSGVCEGVLVDGYIENFALILGSRYFHYNSREKYVLFLEDHERFSSVARVSSLLASIEQSDFINRVSGLIFGHYSENVPDELITRLTRLCEKHDSPGVYCDDFGHGNNHGILPIGVKSRLNADESMLEFLYE